MTAKEGGDALPRLFTGACFRQARVDGNAEIDAGLSVVTRLAPGLPVQFETFLKLGNIQVAQSDKERQAQLGDERKSLHGIGGHPDGRMRLLVRLGRDRGVLEAVELALVGKRLTLPGFLDDLERLAEAGLALAVGDAEHVIRARRAAPPDPELEAPLAQLIHGGGFLGRGKFVHSAFR